MNLNNYVDIIRIILVDHGEELKVLDYIFLQDNVSIHTSRATMDFFLDRHSRLWTGPCAERFSIPSRISGEYFVVIFTKVQSNITRLISDIQHKSIVKERFPIIKLKLSDYLVSHRKYNDKRASLTGEELGRQHQALIVTSFDSMSFNN